MIKISKGMRMRQEILQRGDQLWQRAQAKWESLGKYSRIFALAAHLQDDAFKAGKILDGEMAYWRAVEMLELPLFAIADV